MAGYSSFSKLSEQKIGHLDPYTMNTGYSAILASLFVSVEEINALPAHSSAELNKRSFFFYSGHYICER